jgi:hypothetical protein
MGQRLRYEWTHVPFSNDVVRVVIRDETGEPTDIWYIRRAEAVQPLAHSDCGAATPKHSVAVAVGVIIAIIIKLLLKWD